eukprot:CAMPEP_0204626372 /NCGR_PEP_ID=MMETSP0717-20131115/12081_1 /ASSEMBLY_ACC=CAM_ASM_000666 /TAXON_ID=230516 /ORGANISM="Chaetoceros curvisetus" /LENGTH=237 /DNA_ID=CAMNT_0051642307 /DNA_START=112 /DNA_END=826 /DNA_ORIENTATION=-
MILDEFSGLAVEPNTADPDSLLSSIRANAEAADASSSSGGAPPRRTITMYRSSFTVDNGPERRLDDPSNAEFLKDLARGIVPRELQGEAEGGEATVGLVDKRKMEYCDDRDGAGRNQTSEPSFSSFTGEGQSLGGGVTAAAGGVITPSSDTEAPPEVDESSPKTMIQVRLLNGKRLRITINKNAKLTVLVQHINASGDAGEENYVLSAGFPPKILEDLEMTVEATGLAGSQVIQKKA